MTMQIARPLISLVVPVFNEEPNIFPFYEAVKTITDGLAHTYDFEFVFTDNHSTDRTFEHLTTLSYTDARIRVYRFSRNFGYQRSIMTGYSKARGDAAIQLDCDLQDPPELIETFLNEWRKGADVVYGVRIKRKEGWTINTARSIFYRLIDKVSEDRIPVDAGDFRLVSRRIIQILRDLDDAQPYLRGSIAALGFTQVGIPYERNARERGESKFPFSKLVSLAIDGILNHSRVPLRLSTYFGLATSFVTLAGIFIYALIKLLTHAQWPAGFATLAALILASISINAMLLGIIGEYLGRMYQQGRKRPLTIVQEVIDHAHDRENPSLQELP
jgi:glycosyltransferase involved in cell wall biosynthesis